MSELKSIQTELISIIDVSKDDDVTYTFRCTRPENMEWEVGSNGHFSFREPTGDKETDKPHQRHMSLISHPDEPELCFTTKIRENASSYKSKLRELKKGDNLILYKLNNRMPIRREGKPLVFLSMGVAVGTCRPYFLDFAKNADGIPLIESLNIEKSGTRLYEKEFEGLTRKNLINRYFRHREKFYEALDDILQNLEGALFYIIGSDSFLEYLCRYLLNHGVEESSISIDKKKSITDFLAASKIK